MDELERRSRFASIGVLSATIVLVAAGNGPVFFYRLETLLHEESAPKIVSWMYRDQGLDPDEYFSTDALALVEQILLAVSVLAGVLAIAAAAMHPRVNLLAKTGFLRARMVLQSIPIWFSWGIVLVLILALLAVTLPWAVQLVLGLGAAVLWLRTDGARRTPAQMEKQDCRHRMPITAMLGVMVVALGFRLSSLGNFQRGADENLHIAQALGLMAGDDLTYLRAEIVTRAVARAYKITPPIELMDFYVIGRVPGALLSAATVIPICMLSRHFGSRTALLASLLWAVHPWAVGVGRVIREYAYFSFFSTAAMAAGVALVRRAERRPIFGLAAVLSVSLASVAYAAFDRLSTFTAHVLVTVGVVGGYWTFQTYESSSRRRRLALLAGLPVAAVPSFFLLTQFNVPFGGLFQSRPQTLTFMEIYASGTSILSITNFLLLGIFLATVGLYRLRGPQRQLFAALLVTVFGLLIAMELSWDRYFRPRYAFFLLPSFLVLLSAGLNYFLSDAWKRVELLVSAKSRSVWGLALLSGLIVYAVPITSLGYDVWSGPQKSQVRHKFTDEHTYMITGITSLLVDQAGPEDAIVGTLVAFPLQLVDAPVTHGEQNIFGYDYRTSARAGHPTIYEAIEKFDQGFIVLDHNREAWSVSLPREHPFIVKATRGEVCVMLWGQVESHWLWRWGDDVEPSICKGAIRLDDWLTEQIG